MSSTTASPFATPRSSTLDRMSATRESTPRPVSRAPLSVPTTLRDLVSPIPMPTGQPAEETFQSAANMEPMDPVSPVTPARSPAQTTATAPESSTTSAAEGSPIDMEAITAMIAGKIYRNFNLLNYIIS